MVYNFIISGQIGVAYDWWTGQRGTTVKQLRDVLDAHKGEELHIAVSSPGGYVDAGLEMYQAIKEHGNVHMHIIGMTASAATFLTQGAKHVDMVKGSLMLIHNASASAVVWQSANKEQLDAIIKQFQKQRDDLNTIDSVIASLYAERSGKTLDECKAKMQRAAWLSPQDALDFGLIDEIRDEQTPQMTNESMRIFNSMTQGYGLPPFPQQPADGSNSAQDGPTKSYLQKAVEAVKAAFRNDPAENNNQPMIKIFNRVMDLLDITDGFATAEDGAVTLSQEQMKKIDDRLGELQDTADEASAAKDEVQKQLDAANATVTDLQAQLDSLKQAPGDESSKVSDTTDEHNEEGAFLDEALKSFNRIKDI